MGDNMRLRLCVLLWVAFSSGLVACGAPSRKPEAKAPVQPFSVVPAEASKPVITKESIVTKLLKQGEQALQRNQLTLPAENNAYDKFQAVALMQPDNAEARAGLQAVELAYAEEVRRALQANRLNEAKTRLQRMAEHFPDDPLQRSLVAELQQAWQRADAQRQQEEAAQEGEERWPLEVADLNQRNAQMRQLLEQLANRVSQSDESVMIYARTDSEGRWIYKIMKDAAGEYRIRGDIRISRTPAIKLMPPL